MQRFSIKTISIVLSVVICASVIFFNEVFFLFGFCLGYIWGYINLLFTQQLMRIILFPEKRTLVKMILLILFKFPVLYALGYALLLIPFTSPWAIMSGFTGNLLLSLIMCLRSPSRISENKFIL